MDVAGEIAVDIVSEEGQFDGLTGWRGGANPSVVRRMLIRKSTLQPDIARTPAGGTVMSSSVWVIDYSGGSLGIDRGKTHAVK